MNKKTILVKIHKDGYEMVRVISGRWVNEIEFDHQLLKEASINLLCMLLEDVVFNTYDCNFELIRGGQHLVVIEKRLPLLKQEVLFIGDYSIPNEA